MKRILLICIFMFAAFELSAQGDTQSTSQPMKQGLTRFTSIDVDAPIKLTLTKIDEYDVPYIIYDTKEVYTSKFSFEVDKGGVLKIRERNDPKRESITEVEVFYNSLEYIIISKADVTANGTIDTPLLDIYVSNDAHFSADIETLDLKISITGKSIVELTGTALYQTADISTGQYCALNLNTMSTTATASHNAVVMVDAYQRLEAKTTTGGKIDYKSLPEIYREDISLFGGEVSQL